MRITPAMLNKIARDTVAQRTRQDHSILAIYLAGSLFSGEPLLGGTADIDLFFIHNDIVSPEREIQRLHPGACAAPASLARVWHN
jgi:hypothetical protein